MRFGGDDEASAVVVDAKHDEAGDETKAELVLEGRTQ